jgi:hypothetical protein
MRRSSWLLLRLKGPARHQAVISSRHQRSTHMRICFFGDRVVNGTGDEARSILSEASACRPKPMISPSPISVDARADERIAILSQLCGEISAFRRNGLRTNRPALKTAHERN